jgi:hypothetical protein
LDPGQRHKKSRITEIGIVFRDLIPQHEVISERAVGEPGQQPMVLVGIALIVGQNERGIEIALNLFETVLDIGALKREISITKAQYLYLFIANAFEERCCTISSLGPARTRSAENDPAHDEIAKVGSQAQNCSAAADLNIVGMGAQAKQLQGLVFLP